MNGGRKKWELENREYTTEEPQILHLILQKILMKVFVFT